MADGRDASGFEGDLWLLDDPAIPPTASMTSVSAELRARHAAGSGVERTLRVPTDLFSESVDFSRDLRPREVWTGWAQPDAAPRGDVKTEAEIRHFNGDRADGNGLRARSPSTTVEIDLDLEEAWEHRAELTEICRRIVGDPAIAEDVVQETYLQAFRNRHKLEQRDGLMPWLVTVAKRRSLNELRRHKYSTPVDEVPERRVDPTDDPAATVAIGDELDRVTSILDTLTDRERELLTRQVYEGATLAELADEEDSTPASVRSVLSRARSKIKAAVKDSAARVLAPVAAVTDWVRNHAGNVHHRLNQTAPVLPAGHEKLTEMIVAGAAGVALLLSTTLPGPAPEPAHAGPDVAGASTLPQQPAMVFEFGGGFAAGAVVAGSSLSDGLGAIGDAGATESESSADSGTADPTDSLPGAPETGDTDPVGDTDPLGGTTLPPAPDTDDDLETPDTGDDLDPGTDDLTGDGDDDTSPNGLPTPDAEEASETVKQTTDDTEQAIDEGEAAIDATTSELESDEPPDSPVE